MPARRRWLLLVMAMSLVLVGFTLRRRSKERADQADDASERSETYSAATRSPEVEKAMVQRNRSSAQDVLPKATEISTDAYRASPSSSSTTPSVSQHHVVKETDNQYKSKLESPNVVNHSFHPVRRKINSVQDWEKHDTSARVRPGAGANRTGYLTALQFWDQQTYSVQNILLFQAWAGWLGVGILEPFLMGTKFGLPLANHEAFHENGTVSYMAMSDVYDVDQWNSEIGGHHFKMSPLTPWGDFLATAPPDVVFINFGRWTGFNVKKDAASLNKTLEKLGFRLVDAHDIKLDWRNPVTEENLKALVYRGNVSPSEVTVIFNCWNRQELPNIIRAVHFNMLAGSALVSLQPSRKLVRDAKQYQLQHLSQNESFIGVLVRAEWLIMNRGPDSREDLLRGCLKRAIGWLHTLGNKTGITDVFVGMDIGRFGSTTLKDLSMSYIQRLGEEFLRASYRDPRMTLTGWEDSFAELSSSQVPGYIAFLQKTIAVRGQCILLIGFGSFQSHALQAYMKLHSKKDYCFLKTDSQCGVKSVKGFDP